MQDIRDRVEEDRGLIKQIQLHVPGFIGYRRREDIRAADSLLRVQMADRLARIREGLEESRSAMAEDYDMKNIERIGGVINLTRTLEGKVRHAEQGYSGFSPAIRIVEEELNKIYEYDHKMITTLLEIEEHLKRLETDASAGKTDEVGASLASVKDSLKEFDRALEERIPRIAGIYNL